MFKSYLLQHFKTMTILMLFMTDVLQPVNGSLPMQQSIVKSVLAKCKTAIDRCRTTGAPCPCRKISFNKDTGTCVIFDQQIPTKTAIATTTPLTTTTALTTTTLLKTTTAQTTTTPLITAAALETTTTLTTTTTATAILLPLSYLSIKYISQSNEQKIFTHSFNTTALTICFWMKMFCSPCGLFAIFNDPLTDVCNSHLIFSENYKIYLFGQEIPSKVFNEGQLYHICIAWKTDKIAFYADGTTYFTRAISDNRLVGNRFILGNDVDAVNGKCIADVKRQLFLGEIAGAYLWDRFLSSTEVSRLYEGTLPNPSAAVNWSHMLNFSTTSAITKTNLVVRS